MIYQILFLEKVIKINKNYSINLVNRLTMLTT